MDVNVNTPREKVKVDEIEVRYCFRTIDSDNYFMRINIVFKDMVVESGVYAVNLDTGEVELFSGDTVVEKFDLLVEER